MPDRKMEFTIAARDEATAIFQKIGGSLEDLRKQLDLPFGPLSKPEQGDLNFAVNKRVVDAMVQNRQRALGAAAGRADINRQVDAAMGNDPRGFSPSTRRARSMQAATLGLARNGGSIGGDGYDITRLRGGLDAFGSKAESEQQSFLKSIHEQKERLERMFKLGGAVAIADVLGQAMQQTAASIEKYGDDIRAGASKSQAFATALSDTLPGIGELAKGFQSMYHALDAGERQRTDEQRKGEELQNQRDVRQGIADKRNAGRQAINQSGKDAYLNAVDSLGSAGLQGDARALAEAETARNKANRQLDELAGKRGQLSPEDALKLDKQIATARAANDAEYEDKKRDIFKAGNEKLTADARAHADQLQSLNADAYTTDLERQGKYLESKIIGIKEEAAREREETKRKYEDALKDPDQNPAVAAQRRDEALDAIRRRSESRQKAAREQAAREANQQRREFERQTFDADQDMGARRLRMFGDADDAEKTQARKAYADRLAEIKQNLDQQIQANAERAPEFREQARKLAEQAGQEFGLTLEEIQQQHEERMRPDFADTFTGNSALRRGALSRTAGAGGGTNYAEKIAKANEEALKVNKEARDFLSTIANALKSGGIQIVVANSN